MSQHLPPEPCDPPTAAPPKPADARRSVVTAWADELAALSDADLDAQIEKLEVESARLLERLRLLEDLRAERQPQTDEWGFV